MNPLNKYDFNLSETNHQGDIDKILSDFYGLFDKTLGHYRYGKVNVELSSQCGPIFR